LRGISNLKEKDEDKVFKNKKNDQNSAQDDDDNIYKMKE